MNHTSTLHFEDYDVTFEGAGYAVRCAIAIANENLPDARWALEVLNRYGHLVEHPADRLIESRQPKETVS